MSTLLTLIVVHRRVTPSIKFVNAHFTLHYITLHYFTLHYITLHYITLHCIALHCIALHCIAVQCITLHYIMPSSLLLESIGRQTRTSTLLYPSDVLLSKLFLHTSSSGLLWVASSSEPLRIPFEAKLVLALFSGFRSVCPIHFHFLLLILSSIRLCCVLSHSSSFEMNSGQRIFRIFLKHLLIKVCNFVDFHVFA